MKCSVQIESSTEEAPGCFPAEEHPPCHCSISVKLQRGFIFLSHLTFISSVCLVSVPTCGKNPDSPSSRTEFILKCGQSQACLEETENDVCRNAKSLNILNGFVLQFVNKGEAMQTQSD